MNAHVPALAGGGQVIAIVPQTFEETMRVSRAVVASGLAPSALIGKLTGDEAAAAVAVAIMSGAELGLKPMVSLRSFTVINGKPALYGDGLINVVRMSARSLICAPAATRRTASWLASAKPSVSTPAKKSGSSSARTTRSARGFGMTGRRSRSRYGRTDRRSGATMCRTTRPGTAFRKGCWDGALLATASESCSATCSAVSVTNFEAREIADAESMRDVTPATESRSTPPKPPKPPAPPSAKVIEAEPEEKVEQPTETEFNLGDFLGHIETSLAGATDEADVEEIWTDFDAPAVLETEGHADMIDAAFSIKTRRLALLSPMNGG